MTIEAKEDQANNPGRVSKSSPASGGLAIVDCQFANSSEGGMPAGDGGSVSLPVLQETEESAVLTSMNL